MIKKPAGSLAVPEDTPPICPFGTPDFFYPFISQNILSGITQGCPGELGIP
jgi:hypothetical protein